MTTPMVGLAVLLIIAVVGWVIAEAKSKAITFQHSEDENEGWEEMHEAFVEHGGKELTLRDLLKKNCTTGYKSI